VTIQWDRSTGHTGAGKYEIFRNGTSIATVGKDQTSYKDENLRPGQSYSYTVLAQSRFSKSVQTAAVSVRTQAPSPQEPKAGKVTTNSAALTWGAPAASPKPDTYEILRDGSTITEVNSDTTSYEDKGLAPATDYRYAVVAKWGPNGSDPTSGLRVRTATPPLAAARLTGSSWDVRFKVTRIDGITNLSNGTSWSDTWDFSAQCGSGACNTTLSGNFTPPGFRPTDFTIRLTRKGTIYSGSTTVHRTSCNNVPGTDQLSVRIQLRGARAEGTEWVASAFAGTVVVIAPRQDVGAFFCPGSRIDSNVAS
jgi:fibronectin type III domain protein